MMTREMDYSLRILHALYGEGQLSAAAIAEKECMSKAVTLKILKQLHAAGLVSSRRGPSGGYALEKPCEELCLSDLFQALGESLLINRCGLCRELSRIQKVLDGELRKTPLSAMFQKPPFHRNGDGGF